MELQEEPNPTTSAMDARERRKLQNRLAQRNFRRRQALKEKQQRNEQQEPEMSLGPSSSESHGEKQSSGTHHVTTTPPDQIQSSYQTSDQQEESWTTAVYPAISTLTNNAGAHSPTHLPISPVSFPLFCSPEDLISDNPGEQIPISVSEAAHPPIPTDLPPISLRITPQPTDPLSQHSPLEPVKPLARATLRRASMNRFPQARRRSFAPEVNDQFQSNGMRRLSESAPSPSLHGASRSSEGKMTLHICAEKGHANLIRFLLNYGAEIDATDYIGRTALHYAALQGHTESVSALLEQGADTELTDEFGFTPLHIAVERGYEAVVRMLVREGADLNARINCKTRRLS
ncbi:Ankyrin repeat domain-containing protein 44 [Aspergillus alliaceus]|uniref:Ankyrin repeat domain-containing protein 44 n=1 Tax=Petromyces alliaceus TaxID=209559 RepID=A0A8H6A3P2_PETAA|nr:Ankyrin repeat domain-containing protein 44 [Aspergillus burnettii]